MIKYITRRIVILLMAEDTQLQYNTPQDKLLVMLLERISSLEDEQRKLRQTVEKNNVNLNNLWATSSSVYFGITIQAKLQVPSNNIGFGAVPTFGAVYAGFGVAANLPDLGINHGLTLNKLDIVKNIILNAFPQCSITVARNKPTTIYLEFESPMILDTLKETLELQLLRHVHILNWSTLSKSEMINILHRHPYEII